MALKAPPPTNLNKIFEQIQTGDVIAFGGNTLFSKWTKLTTNSVVTHVAIVNSVKFNKGAEELSIVELLEATMYKDKFCVMLNPLNARMENYSGDIWWLPLNHQCKTKLTKNRKIFDRFVSRELGKEYDIGQLYGSAVDWFDDIKWLKWLSFNSEDTEKWFCSELIVGLLAATSVINNVHAAEVTPIDICRFNIFEDNYFLLSGRATEIEGFNSISPTNFGY